MDRILPLRITVENPLPGVTLRLQHGRGNLLAPAREEVGEVSFDFTVRVTTSTGGTPNFLGEYAQGRPNDRFVYVNSGRHAGQSDSEWDRRAKVPLGSITWSLVEEVLASQESVLEARISGSAKDGGPAAATVPLLGPGWTVKPRSGRR